MMKAIVGWAAACALLSTNGALAGDRLLDEAVAFTGQIFHLEAPAPGVVIAAVRADESAIFGFGETAKGNGRAPDEATKIGDGSITKTVTGLVLANLVAGDVVKLTDEAAPFVPMMDALPGAGQPVRLVDLATHSSGLARELDPVDGAAKYSDASFAANLESPQLFAPGTGISYSNVGFDLLAMALSQAAGKPYDALVRETVLDPLGMTDTGYERPSGDNVFAGYDWNGEPMDPGEPIPNRFGASALYTTPADMVRYIKWQLDRFDAQGAEARAISHAAWRMRDGLDPVFGMDESGHMDAMGLGWVIMMPEGDRPLIIQKAGGTNGVFSYVAFAPTRGVGVFMAFNEFDFTWSTQMAVMVNDLIAALAPR